TAPGGAARAGWRPASGRRTAPARSRRAGGAPRAHSDDGDRRRPAFDPRRPQRGRGGPRGRVRRVRAARGGRRRAARRGAAACRRRSGRAARRRPADHGRDTPRARARGLRAGRRRESVMSLAWNPAVAIWEVTRACDLWCLHCRAQATPERDPRELSAHESLALVEQLGDLDPGVLVLTGGDPLKRPDLFAIIEAAVRRRLRVAIAP